MVARIAVVEPELRQLVETTVVVQRDRTAVVAQHLLKVTNRKAVLRVVQEVAEMQRLVWLKVVAPELQ